MITVLEKINADLRKTWKELLISPSKSLTNFYFELHQEQCKELNQAKRVPVKLHYNLNIRDYERTAYFNLCQQK